MLILTTGTREQRVLEVGKRILRVKEMSLHCGVHYSEHTNYILNLVRISGLPRDLLLVRYLLLLSRISAIIQRTHSFRRPSDRFRTRPQTCNSNPAQNWKAKDSAIHLPTATGDRIVLATKGQYPRFGETSKDILARDAAELINTGQITVVLAVIQQRPIPSKINDGLKFELLQGVVQYVPP